MINTPLSSAHHSFSANAQSELWLECTPATSSCCTGKQALEKSPGCTNMTYTLFLPSSFICIAYHLSVQAMEQGAGLQDCSMSEIKLLDLLSHCVFWKLYHLKMYHSTSVCEATKAQPSHSLPLLVGADWLQARVGSHGRLWWGVLCSHTRWPKWQQYTMTAWGEETTLFKRLFIRNPWRHYLVPFLIHVAAEQQLSLIASAGVSF